MVHTLALSPVGRMTPAGIPAAPFTVPPVLPCSAVYMGITPAAFLEFPGKPGMQVETLSEVGSLGSGLLD